MWKMFAFAISVHHFAKDDILFVYITIIMRFYITICGISSVEVCR